MKIVMRSFTFFASNSSGEISTLPYFIFLFLELIPNLPKPVLTAFQIFPNGSQRAWRKSLIGQAFERVYVELGLSIRPNYVDVRWPLIFRVNYDAITSGAENRR